jgi:uncharacterized protein
MYDREDVRPIELKSKSRRCSEKTFLDKVEKVECCLVGGGTKAAVPPCKGKNKARAKGSNRGCGLIPKTNNAACNTHRVATMRDEELCE